MDKYIKTEQDREELIALIREHSLNFTAKLTKDRKRTSLQNRSEHKYFQLLADALNESGQDMRHVLKESVDIPWTMQSVKDLLFRPVAVAMYDVESTADLTTVQTQEVYNVLNRHTGQKLGVSIDWPCDEYP